MNNTVKPIKLSRYTIIATVVAITVLGMLLLIWRISLSGLVAVSGNTDDFYEKRAHLLQTGFPANYINQLIDPVIEHMYMLVRRDDILLLDTSFREPISMVTASNSTLIQGSIPESTLGFNISTIAQTTEAGHIEKIIVLITYDWHQVPFFRNTDIISSNWNANILTYVENSFISADFAKNSHGNWMAWADPHPIAELIQGDSEHVEFYTHLNYSVSIGFPMGATRLQGIASFALTPKIPMLPTSIDNLDRHFTNINANYIHEGNQFLSQGGTARSGTLAYMP